MSFLPGVLFFVGFAAAGVVLIVGAKRRWRWLVDPPPELWACYSQAFVRRIFGETTLLIYTYTLGIMFIMVSAFVLYNEFATAVSR